MRLIFCRRLAILLGITTFTVFFISIRLAAKAIWFPPIPMTIGNWNATEVPLDRQTLDQLGSPPADGYRYINPFGERVECTVIATTTYAAYREPTICMTGYGFSKTALKTMSFLGPNRPVRALILRNTTDGQRVLMYYWVQYKDGLVSNPDRLSLHQNSLSRLTVGWDKTLHTEPSCLIRAYIHIHAADRLGLQARRNLELVCRELYEAMKTDGARS